MSEDEIDDVASWGELPPAERRALRRAAQSQIWWSQLGRRIKGSGPIISALLAMIALWQLMGEGVKEWLGK
jgi:hypothetical protein